MNIYNGDCLEVMKNIPNDSIDMVLCDLPYGTTDCEWDKVIDLNKLWKEYERICREGAAIVLFGDNNLFTAKLCLSKEKWFKYNWIWKKNRALGFLNCKVQPLRNIEAISVFYKPYKADNYEKSDLNINKLNYLKSELIKSGKSKKEINNHFKTIYIHWFSKCQYSLIDEKRYNELHKWTNCFDMNYNDFIKLDKIEKNDSKNIYTYNPQMIKVKEHVSKYRNIETEIYGYKIKKKNSTKIVDEAYPRMILEFNKESKSLHPTQKPVDLLEYLVKTYTNEGEMVLDNCMGVGSTGVACQNTNRDFIGIEIDDNFFNIAKNRLKL